MFDKTELNDWLESVGKRIERPLKIYMIGGGALSFKGLKVATKDIDIVLTSQEDFNILDNAIKKAGFEIVSDMEDEFYLAALAVYTKKDSRIDVFVKQVGKMLVLAKDMVRRAQYHKNYGKLRVYLIANEDIFLFKLMTTREGDITDCDRLMREELNYDIIYNEIVEQSKNSERWFFWVYESLCRLEEHNGIRTPIKSKVFSLVKKHWKDKPVNFMEGIGNLEKHIPDKKLLRGLKQRS